MPRKLLSNMKRQRRDVMPKAMQSVHEEQLEKLSQKKEKEKEERINCNNKEVGERISVRDILSSKFDYS